MVMLETVTPAASVTVIAPAVPLFAPMIALYPEDQIVSLDPLDQLALVEDQFPAPSVGAVELVPLASHVNEFPSEMALRVTVTALAVVLLNMNPNSSNVATLPTKGVTGLM